MRILNIEYVESGMVLGRPIYDGAGSILLGAGVELTTGYLSRLTELGYSQVYVETPETLDVEIRELMSDEMRRQSIATVKKIFNAKSLDFTAISRLVDDIMDEVFATRGVILQMYNLKDRDSYTYQHSVDACCLGIGFGRRLQLDSIRLKKLAIGLLLHDIGKVTIPDEILNKPGKFTPEEYKKMQTHPMAGWHLLKDCDDLSPLSRAVVLQHHEKWDGTGYPAGLKGDEIHPFGQIGAIIEVWDALTSDRVYRPKFQPHEALEYMMGSAGRHFSADLVKKFLRSVPPYKIGATVKLSTGEIGVVVAVDTEATMRPRVRLLDSPIERDLSMEIDITVTEVL